MFNSISFSPHDLYNPMETAGNSYNTHAEDEANREKARYERLASLVGLLSLARAN